VRAESAAQPDRRLQAQAWPQLAAVVAGGALFNALLAVPIRRPRVFGDELIYWQLARGLAWTGHFTVRGVAAPRYGVVYPALLAVAQRLGSDQTAAYAIAQVLNAVVFSLTAVPVYVIASRVLKRRHALLAAWLAVVLPSCVYTSSIMTENAFYPLFLSCALLMVRALERPSAARQLLVAAAVAVTFLARAQAVVLLPSYLLAAVLLAMTTSRGRKLSTLAASLRQHAPTIAVLAFGAIAGTAVRGSSTLGPYHVLVTSYGLRPFAHWALANVADLELYLGVIPLAAFGILLVQALSPASLSLELRRFVLLTACLGAGLLATVAALSASKYGLGRLHERNLFYLAPLVLISFLVWLEAGLPRPRRTTAAVAVAMVLLPLAIPASAVKVSGEDGIALLVWADMKIRSNFAIAGMVLVSAIAAAVFLRSRRPAIPLGICLAALVASTIGGEYHAVDSLTFNRDDWRDFGWIDRSVGSNARVAALWATTRTGPQVTRIEGLWADEFFNRSVRGVGSADGPLPDGLPVEELKIRPDGCVAGTLRSRPQYAVVESVRRLTAPVVALSPSKRAVLYRLDARKSDRCFARLQPG
jgi:Dolichyl-phosphate-mannose-protein mannosyltransferase